MKKTRMQNPSAHSLRVMSRLRSSGTVRKVARKMGMFPTGSMTKKGESWLKKVHPLRHRSGRGGRAYLYYFISTVGFWIAGIRAFG